VFGEALIVVRTKRIASLAMLRLRHALLLKVMLRPK
jgi:hypothetical protein